mmetsp:Transcript_4751/g.12742  ORF Transcript_4751/g.12742 Transcript_4751/m.12742 type:complete len:220 (+) Transcript_4751:517-1176(+)
MTADRHGPPPEGLCRGSALPTPRTDRQTGHNEAQLLAHRCTPWSRPVRLEGVLELVRAATHVVEVDLQAGDGGDVGALAEGDGEVSPLLVGEDDGRGLQLLYLRRRLEHTHDGCGGKGEVDAPEAPQRWKVPSIADVMEPRLRSDAHVRQLGEGDTLPGAELAASILLERHPAARYVQLRQRVTGCLQDLRHSHRHAGRPHVCRVNVAQPLRWRCGFRE